ncbi:hypothetical protein [Acinetobacter pittii]|uniref:hypothetical protein n=1 Tax=Acinetobacter pittii TaxID=48296 RepID=UPI001C4BBD0F|nr:hypothetical protein [Acinetobacter pittii]
MVNKNIKKIALILGDFISPNFFMVFYKKVIAIHFLKMYFKYILYRQINKV